MRHTHTLCTRSDIEFVYLVGEREFCLLGRCDDSLFLSRCLPFLKLTHKRQLKRLLNKSPITLFPPQPFFYPREASSYHYESLTRSHRVSLLLYLPGRQHIHLACTHNSKFFCSYQTGGFTEQGCLCMPHFYRTCDEWPAFSLHRVEHKRNLI